MYSIILSLILLIILIFFVKKKHPFWDEQPVMREYGPIKKIGTIPDFDINLEKGMYFSESFNTNNLEVFLNKEFSDNFNVPRNYLNYILSLPTSKNICLFSIDHEIIGFIHGREIKLVIDQRSHKMFYVDYLCVDKELRNKNIAGVIIANFLQSFQSDESFLFKIEKYPLPFKHLIKTKYFCKVLQNKKIEKKNVKLVSEENNIDEVYNYFSNLLKRYKIYVDWNKKKFIDVFLREKILDMIIIEGEFKSLIIGKTNTYKIEKNYYKCFEIDFILGDLNDGINIDKELSEYLGNLSYKYYTIPNIGEHEIFIKKNKLKCTYSLYYYVYNLQIPNIGKDLFCININ